MGQTQQTDRHDLSIQVENDCQYAEATDILNVPIPLIREEVEVRKELVDKATVRITKVVEEKPETINELLASEHIEIERFPLDQIVATPPSVRLEGDVRSSPLSKKSSSSQSSFV